jgi:SP family general alpha glucoside:H+ symporter-like MFS transporter
MSHDIETVPPNYGEKNAVEHVSDIKTDEANFRADAMEAENVEHNMTVMQAVKAYPMACLWAFIMSSTIVSYFGIPCRPSLRFTDHGGILCLLDG